MAEITQLELEQLESRIAHARDLFLVELRKHPEAARLYSQMIELEHRCIDARRARRASELQEKPSEL